MFRHAHVDRQAHVAIGAVPVEAQRADWDAPTLLVAQVAQGIDSDCPGAVCQPRAAQDFDARRRPVRCGEDVEPPVRRALGSNAVARHALSVVLVHAPLAVGPVAALCVVVLGGVGARLSEEVGKEVVQLEAVGPVAAEAGNVETLKTGDIPRDSSGLLFVNHAVLVDAEGRGRDVVLLEH
ncbi:uncharacterized protein N7498_006014 [Penicillium cinerascens]|uniref:Uncharacterized protein n=1 Tax=Penicillium cinerascens TaxID=70096 RepID=A0A9W9SX08_9EURO|nr:uncharacterized protein N7498_006014 [Penicillium cinerascens]KAJ5201351.1 hypothetical protein N7498_006014 [Penicillium cinerascens]